MEKHIKILKQLLIIYLSNLFEFDNIETIINDETNSNGKYFIQNHIYDNLK
jgi:hypothetical protein